MVSVSGDGSVVVGVSAYFIPFEPAADGWTELSIAEDISADGNTIAGYGIRNGNIEAFITVVPEPASIGQVLPLAAATLRRHRNLTQGI